MIESLAHLNAPARARPLTPAVEQRILAGVLAASNDACWCMEFGEPVDLTAPDHEVVRQVFENDPFWRLANPAMAQLYLLDGGQAITDRPVSEIFPRNRQNEEFVLNLLANGFEVDAAPALDCRYDGVQIYVENDVRAHIEGGRLIRMFGIVRDVGKHRRREVDLQRQLDAALALVSAVADPLIAVNQQGVIEAVNLAAAALFGRQMEECLGQHFGPLMTQMARNPGKGHWPALLDEVMCDGVAARLNDTQGALWTVTPRPAGGAVLSASGAGEAVLLGGAA